jgi:hypothetical protein
LADVPEDWRTAPVVHLAPVAQEVDPALVRAFPGALVGVTPQGWMRIWNALEPASSPRSLVRRSAWPNAHDMVAAASAVVVSLDDIGGDFRAVETWLRPQSPLVVTQGEAGATVFWRGERRTFAARHVAVRDPTGAGDVFAACFFATLWRGGDAWSAAAAATDVATRSISS